MINGGPESPTHQFYLIPSRMTSHHTMSGLILLMYFSASMRLHFLVRRVVWTTVDPFSIQEILHVGVFI